MQRPASAGRSVLLTLASGWLLALSCAPGSLVHASDPPQLKTASTHPIQYYLSLPEGWTNTKKWPVVVVIDSAERDFLQAATAFAQARGSRPFILVTPLVVTNGGAGFRSGPTRCLFFRNVFRADRVGSGRTRHPRSDFRRRHLEHGGCHASAGGCASAARASRA